LASTKYSAASRPSTVTVSPASRVMVSSYPPRVVSRTLTFRSAVFSRTISPQSPRDASTFGVGQGSTSTSTCSSPLTSTVSPASALLALSVEALRWTLASPTVRVSVSPGSRMISPSLPGWFWKLNWT
jgi:hypothetical protein